MPNFRVQAAVAAVPAAIKDSSARVRVARELAYVSAQADNLEACFEHRAWEAVYQLMAKGGVRENEAGACALGNMALHEGCRLAMQSFAYDALMRALVANRGC